MAKGLIVYASQSGTTRAVAERIGTGLARGGHQTVLRDLSPSRRVELDGCEFLGVGSPTCIFRPSYLALDFLSQLAPPDGLPVFTFVTFGTEIGDAANWLRRRLAKTGAREIGHFRCNGKNLFPGYTSRAVLFSPSTPLAHELADAEEFGQRMGAHLTAGTAEPTRQCDPPTHPVLRLERALTSRPLARHLYSRFFKSRHDRCLGCRTCERTCPTGNIRPGADGQPRWGRDCILCFACENACPQRAIRTPLAWPVFAPFLRFNIRRGQRHGVPFARLSPEAFVVEDG